MSITLMQGDCLERMKEIESGSVDAVICDLPYGTMKGAGLDGWTEGKTYWDECINHDELLNEYNRILRTNGALILFSQDPFTGKLMTEQHGNLPFSYRYTWLKDHFANALIAKKAPVNHTEDVCVFFKKHTKHDFEGFHPLRPYAKHVTDHIGKSKRQIFSEMGHQGMCHFMRHETTQFLLCTNATYNQLIDLYGINNMPGYRPFDELAAINADYRLAMIKRMNSASPKLFNRPQRQKYKSNVLAYKKDYDGYHPTQKPVKLIEDLIKTYTNEGDIVLDNTMGSGSTGVAAINTVRKFIGIELDENYFQIAKNRIEQAQEVATALRGLNSG
jgi:DNA modification methylase